MPKFIALTDCKEMVGAPVPDFINADQIIFIRVHWLHEIEYASVHVGGYAFYVNETCMEILKLIARADHTES
jgi:hypothetical protein